MAKRLHDDHDIVRDTFAEASDALNLDLARLCFDGPVEQLTDTRNAQPAILTTSVAMYRFFKASFDIEPSAAAGHSLGEFSALATAGAIAFRDAVQIVRRRGQFMSEAVEPGFGAMAAISGATIERVETLCRARSKDGRSVAISNVNSLQQVVISGERTAVHQIADALTAEGAIATLLKVSAPFHCELMKSAAEKLNTEIAKYSFASPAWPVISNVTARPHADTDTVAALLIRQVTAPVMWQTTMEQLSAMGVDTVLELGPGSILNKLVAQSGTRITAYSFDRDPDMSRFAKVATSTTDSSRDLTEDRPSLITRSLAIAVSTKNNNWDNEAYRRGVIEPYQKIQRLQEELEGAAASPTREQLYSACAMLQSVFETKGTPQAERLARFQQLFAETGNEGLFPEFMEPSDAAHQDPFSSTSVAASVGRLEVAA